jgi:hypothetical protein
VLPSVRNGSLKLYVLTFCYPPHLSHRCSEEDMKNYVLSTGPVSVCIDASEWETYQSGVVASCGSDVNHCVQVGPI